MRVKIEPAVCELFEVLYAKNLSSKHLMLYFGEIGRHGSADVIVQLSKMKCFPVFLYGLEACPVNNTEIK